MTGSGCWLGGAAFFKLVLAFTELQRAGPSAAALRLVEEADATFGELGDPWGEAFAGHSRLAFESYYRGLPEGAEEIGRRVLERFEALDDQWGVAQSQFGIAEFAKARGDLGTARAAYERGCGWAPSASSAASWPSRATTPGRPPCTPRRPT